MANQKLNSDEIRQVCLAISKGYTQTVIAKSFGISQARVSQIGIEYGLRENKKKYEIDIKNL